MEKISRGKGYFHPAEKGIDKWNGQRSDKFRLKYGNFQAVRIAEYWRPMRGKGHLYLEYFKVA